MAAKAAVLIDLTATDASPQLEATAAAARGAATAIGDTEDATKAARAELRAIAKESALSERAFRDLAKAADLIGVDAAAGLVTVAHGSERTRKALDRLEAQAKQTDRAMDGVGKRFGDVGGDLARFGGQMDVLGDTGRPITLLGDAIELLSSPLGAAVGLTAAWGAAMGGTIAGAVALVAASDDLIERLDAIGQTEVVTGEQREQLRVARASIDAIGDSWAVIGLTLAAEVGPEIESATALLVGASLEAGKALSVVAGSVDLLEIAVNALTGGLIQQVRFVAAALDSVQSAMAGLSPTAKIALNVATGGASGLVEMAANAADALGDAADRAQEQGREWIRTTDAARTAGETITTGMDRAATSTRTARDEAEDYALALSSAATGLQGIINAATGDTLDPATRAIRDFGAELEKIAELDIGPEVAGLVDAAQDAVQGRLVRVLDEIKAQEQVALDAFAALPAASAVALDAMRAARQATMQSVAGGVQGLAGVAGGDIGGALSLAGPGGMIAATLVELGPDSAEMLDERLSAIGENIIKLPETLAKLLATLVGFGADSRGEGIGRALGLAAGIGAALALPGVGLVAGAGIAAGSAAAGGAVGASLSREERRERRDRRDRPRVIVNGIMTAEVVRVLDREARTIGGPRGRRYRLDRE